jgi:hypothetical protein
VSHGEQTLPGVSRPPWGPPAPRGLPDSLYDPNDGCSMRRTRLFEVAAAWNVVAGAGAVAQPALYYRLAYAYDGPIDAVWLQMHVGFWFLIVLFGVGYARVGRDPKHNRGVLVLGVLGKTAFALFWIAQFVAWRATTLLALGAVGDLVFAGLFARWLLRHPVSAGIRA